MSRDATYWAWEQAVKSSQKLTLLALARSHNEKTNQCNPSISTVSKMTGLNRKTIIHSLSELQSIGLIILTKVYGTNTNYTFKTSTNLGTTHVNTTSTNNGTSPVPKAVPVPNSVPVPKTDKTSTNLGQDQYQKRDTKEKKEKKEVKQYAFEGETIRLNEKDFLLMTNQYKNLDLITELNQLDIELRGEKKWFATMNAKLNYRNKNHGTSKPAYPKSSAVGRVNSTIDERARRRAEALPGGGEVIHEERIGLEAP